MKGKSARILVSIDGGSRGNPGPAAFGVVIEGVGKMREYSEFLGKATNNETEYQALLFALKKVKALAGKKALETAQVEVRSDSELLVNQVMGRFKIEEPRIQKLFLEFWNVKVDFSHLVVKAIPREENKRADQLVNQTLDAQTSTLPGF